MILGQIFDCFADDTSLFIIVDDPMTAAGCINADLGKNLSLGFNLACHLQSYKTSRGHSFDPKFMILYQNVDSHKI